MMLPIVWMLSKLRFRRVPSGDKCGREGPAWVSVNTNYEAVIHCTRHNHRQQMIRMSPTFLVPTHSLLMLNQLPLWPPNISCMSPEWVIVDTNISCFSQSVCHYTSHLNCSDVTPPSSLDHNIKVKITGYL